MLKKTPIILFVLFGICTSLVAQNDKGSFKLSGGINNQWFWRGYSVGPDVILTAQASYQKGGFEIGTWNAQGVQGIFKDADTYVSYATKCGLKFSLWDIFNYSDYAASPSYAKYGDHSQANYFDYGKNTRHFIDLSAAYTVPKTNLNLFLATIVAGRDKNADFSNRYSTYAKASYDFHANGGITVTPFTSLGFALNSQNGGTFWQWTDLAVAKAHQTGINELGINLSKKAKITDHYSFGVNGGVVASPINHTITGLMGISVF